MGTRALCSYEHHQPFRRAGCYWVRGVQLASNVDSRIHRLRPNLVRSATFANTWWISTYVAPVEQGDQGRGVVRTMAKSSSASDPKQKSMLTLTGSAEDDPRVMEWIADHNNVLGRTAADWFRLIRQSGSDVTELLHDGHLTACIEDFPFAYVGAFKSHVNVGFFYGAELPDPASLLEGSGKRMRHVKVKPGKALDSDALATLIAEAYVDIKERISN